MKALLLISLLLSLCMAEIKRPSLSALNTDPSVIYVEDFTTEKIRFKVIEERPIFLTKTGKQQLGRLKVGTICELIGFDHRAFKIKGEALHNSIAGWVSPHALESEQENFIEDFKKLYERELLVRELIANEEIAIGMSPDEVKRVLGKPSKTSLRRTSTGTSETYEYLEIEELKHYETYLDPYTEQYYRRQTHVTEEIKSRIAVEFSDGSVSAIEKDEDNSRKNRRPRIIAGPIYLDWGQYIVR